MPHLALSNHHFNMFKLQMLAIATTVTRHFSNSGRVLLVAMPDVGANMIVAGQESIESSGQ